MRMRRKSHGEFKKTRKCLKVAATEKDYSCTTTPLDVYLIEETLSEREHRTWTTRHNVILGTRQNELFNYSNKDFFLRKTLLGNVFYYSVIVMIM